MTIKKDNGYGTTYVFEVVKKIPAGFQIWNIGGCGEYIPLCEAVDYSVNVNTLKAIKLDKEKVEILNSAASCGVSTLKAAKTTLKRVAKSSMMKRKQQLAEKALPILESITE